MTAWDLRDWLRDRKQDARLLRSARVALEAARPRLPGIVATLDALGARVEAGQEAPR